jgi:Nuclease A inhibitor-like protein
MMKKKKKINENKTINFVESKRVDFSTKLAEMREGLIYMSETDAEFTVFKGSQIEKLSKETVLAQIKGSPIVAFEEQNFDEFFLRLTTIKDWFGELEKQRSKRFGELQEFMKANLKDLKVFRTGKIKIDIYIVGIDAENYLIGLKTNAVET